jgi:hypothetical protein
VALAGALGGLGCRGGSREPLLTYFNGDFGFSVRYPASWRSQQAVEGGVFYRHFLGPSGSAGKPSLAATAFVASPGRALASLAESYTANATGVVTRDEAVAGAKGKSYAFASPDGATRQTLLLIEDHGRVYGLHLHGESAVVERETALLDEIRKSFTLERAEAYPETRDDALGFAVRIPESWRETRHFKGGGNAVIQFSSPAIAADKGGETVHASLSLSVEDAPGDGSLDAYYRASRAKLGESFLVLDHDSYAGGGYLDRLRTETQVATSEVKRLYRVSGGRGYSLTLEARDDVYVKVARWYDLFAATLRVGDEIQKR